MFNQDVFYKYLDSVCNNEFKLGTFDCFTFLSVYYEKRYEREFFKSFKGRYKTHSGWMRLIKKNGYKNLKELLDSEFKSNHINLARRGDIVLYEGEALGLCDGAYSVFLSQDKNYSFSHIQTCKCDGAWTI